MVFGAGGTDTCVISRLPRCPTAFTPALTRQLRHKKINESKQQLQRNIKSEPVGTHNHKSSPLLSAGHFSPKHDPLIHTQE